jgi:glycosyltransferase involved in cell wall biosynthesis
MWNFSDRRGIESRLCRTDRAVAAKGMEAMAPRNRVQAGRSNIVIEKPLVSVVVPVYNAGPYLREAVESVLSQSYDNLDIILIDDGSTDECVATIRDIEDSRIRIVTQANSGRPAALNRGLDMARGEFFLIQDADDASYPERVERQVAVLLENPDLGVVYVGNDLILNNGSRFAPIVEFKDREQCREEVLRFAVPAHDATGLYRMSLVGDMRFDDIRLAEGVDFVWRVGERFPMICLGECLYSHRVNYGSITHRDPARSVAAINTVIERACVRRGCESGLYRIALPRERKFFAHRTLDTIVPYAVHSVVSLKQKHRLFEGFKTAWRCVRLHPLDPYYYKPFVFALAPLAAIRGYRRTKVTRRRLSQITNVCP